MRLGFLGAGAISSAVIRGLCRSAAAAETEAIIISPRSARTAEGLARDFRSVRIAKDNQAVIDAAEIVFIALPGAVCAEELQKLRFRPEQKLVSFVPNLDCAALRRLTGGQAAVFRAVPLPFVARHKSVTPIFPADSDLGRLFSAIGGAIFAADEAQLCLFMAAGSMMGVYYRFCGLCAEWLAEQGLPQAQAYTAKLFAALAEEAQGAERTGADRADAGGAAADKNFAALQAEYSTKGGTNELIAEVFAAQGGARALRAALDAGLARIKGR